MVGRWRVSPKHADPAVRVTHTEPNPLSRCSCLACRTETTTAEIDVHLSTCWRTQLDATKPREPRYGRVPQDPTETAR